ncbi:hypothetical protein GCM10017691_13630 [Pseudonocardia petroleophila]
MRNCQRTALNVLVVLSLAVLSGCTVEAPEPVAPVAVPDAATPDAPADGCPVLAPEADGPIRSGVAIDYTDFVNHAGRRYLAGFNEAAPVARTDLGDVVLRSRCSLSTFNEITGRDPGRPRDGDTAFLPQGTAIRTVRGWAPECRLAAERDGQVYVYLALDPSAERAQPASCALD